MQRAFSPGVAALASALKRPWANPHPRLSQRATCERAHWTMIQYVKTRIPEMTLSYDDTSFELAGPAEALRGLASAVELAREPIVVSAGEGDEAFITVTRSSGPLAMTHDGPHAVLAGSKASLEHFAQTLRFVATGPQTPSPVGYHAHVEYFPGHLWIAESSDPVIITLED